MWQCLVRGWIQAALERSLRLVARVLGEIVRGHPRPGHHAALLPVELRDETVTLKSLKNGRTKTITADFVLLLTGYKSDMHLFRKVGAKLKNPWDVPEYNSKTMETSVSGLYVAGTAAAGTQKSYRLFIENCHIHVDRIVASLKGEIPPVTPKFRKDLES